MRRLSRQMISLQHYWSTFSSLFPCVFRYYFMSIEINFFFRSNVTRKTWKPLVAIAHAQAEVWCDSVTDWVTNLCKSLSCYSQLKIKHDKWIPNFVSSPPLITNKVIIFISVLLIMAILAFSWIFPSNLVTKK